MLDLFRGTVRTCERIERRTLLQIGSLAGLGVALPDAVTLSAAMRPAPARASSPAIPQRSRTAAGAACILIWTHGGTSHHDTFDPKPTAPANIKGEFGVIDTAVPGVQFAEIVPRMAAELNRFALLRGWNPKNGSHGTADQWCMSGRQFTPAFTYPCYGSVISHQKGFQSVMPPFVQLGNSLDRRFGGGTAGILGLEHSPFEILADPDAPQFAVRDITPPKGTDMVRIERRRNMLATVDLLQRKADLQPAAFDALDVHYKAALNMITARETKRAFAIEEEDPRLRDRYGRNRFGQSCLLARRLIQSGVRFVTITDPGWDTHASNFKSLKETRIPPVDQALPELLIDLQQQGMLEKTLVVWLTDFGRTPKINAASGRDHWASAGFAIMAGAGVPGGAVLGATDGQGERPIRNEYSTDDIAATIYAKLGLPLDLMVTAPDGRPIRLNEGHVIREWM